MTEVDIAQIRAVTRLISGLHLTAMSNQPSGSEEVGFSLLKKVYGVNASRANPVGYFSNDFGSQQSSSSPANADLQTASDKRGKKPVQSAVPAIIDPRPSPLPPLTSPVHHPAVLENESQVPVVDDGLWQPSLPLTKGQRKQQKPKRDRSLSPTIADSLESPAPTDDVAQPPKKKSAVKKEKAVTLTVSYIQLIFIYFMPLTVTL